MINIIEVTATCPKCNTVCHFPVIQQSTYNGSKCWPGHCRKCGLAFVIVIKPLECLACLPSRNCTCIKPGRRVLANA
jgi:hypothetical protein